MKALKLAKLANAFCHLVSALYSEVAHVTRGNKARHENQNKKNGANGSTELKFPVSTVSPLFAVGRPIMAFNCSEIQPFSYVRATTLLVFRRRKYSR